MTLVEFRNNMQLDAIPRITAENFSLVWISGYWHGPSSGMLKFNGEECWFTTVAENDDDTNSWYRRLAVVRLSKEQLEREKSVHADFQRYVGTHQDADLKEEKKTRHPESMHHLFYDNRDSSAWVIYGR